MSVMCLAKGNSISHSHVARQFLLPLSFNGPVHAAAIAKLQVHMKCAIWDRA